MPFVSFPVKRKKPMSFSAVLNGGIEVTNIGRDVVFSADLCYNGVGDANG